MSKASHPSTNDGQVELGTAVSWPHIYAAGGVALAVLIAVIVFLLVPRRAAVPKETPILVASVPPAPAKPTSTLTVPEKRSQTPSQPAAGPKPVHAKPIEPVPAEAATPQP